MYLKDFTELVKKSLEREGHDIAKSDKSSESYKFNWDEYGWNNENGKNNNKWRVVSYREGTGIHYEFTRRESYDIYFEIHCHHPNQTKWNELHAKMMDMGKGIVEGDKCHPTLPEGGSKIISHKDSVRLTGKKYLSSDPELIKKVKDMAEIVKEMYTLYDKLIQANLKDFLMS
jgi:hypothetical protein